MNPSIIALLVLLSILIAAYAMWGSPLSTENLLEKIKKKEREDFISVEEQVPLQENPESSNAQFARKFGKMIKFFSPKKMASADKSDLHKKILLSGNPFNVEDATEFRGVQISFAIIVAFIGAFAALVIGQSVPIGAGIGAAIGAYFPILVTNQEIKERAGEMKKILPEALDLLTVSMSAGQNFQPALGIVAQNMPESIVQKEFSTLSRNVQSGMSTKNALLMMKEKFDSAELDAFVKAINRGQETGSDVIKILEKQSEHARLSYESDINQKVAKLESKILAGVIIPIEVPAFLAMSMIVPIYQIVTQGAF